MAFRAQELASVILYGIFGEKEKDLLIMNRFFMDKKVFTHAIVRKPGPNFSDGITTQNLGAPDFQKTLGQHATYCEILEQYGLKLTVLDSETSYPDAPFVEDTVVVAGKIAVITRLGDQRRQGEEKKIFEILTKFFDIKTIKSPGTIDGGDVLKIDDHFYIGISQRTNEVGAKQLAGFLQEAGFTSSFVPVADILHLKTGITYIGNNTVVAIQEFAAMKEFQKFHIITVDQDESCSANCLLINGNLLIPAGFPKTEMKIREHGHMSNIVQVEISEFQKMDGGLTCLSILF